MTRAPAFKPHELPDAWRRALSADIRRDIGVETDAEGADRVKAGHERELQSLCETELIRHGIEHLHLSPRAREKKGWPDLTFACNGVPVAVELKTEKGRLSDAQKAVKGRMEANGWRYHICRSFSAFRGILRQYEQSGGLQ